MKLDLIKFKTAKIAKEKGFDIETIYYYDFIGDICSSTINSINWNASQTEMYSTPTQALLKKWLHDVEGVLFVEKFFTTHQEKFVEHTYVCDFYYDNKWYKSPRLETPEEALEYALQKALETLN